MVKPGNRILLGFSSQDLWICVYSWTRAFIHPKTITGHLLCACAHAKSLQSCPTLCDPMDCSPPGLGVLCPWGSPGKILEWVVVPSSRGPSRHKDQATSLMSLHWQAGSLPLVPPGKSPLTLCLMLNAWNRITNKSKIISVLKKLTFCWGGVYRK